MSTFDRSAVRSHFVCIFPLVSMAPVELTPQVPGRILDSHEILKIAVSLVRANIHA